MSDRGRLCSLILSGDKTRALDTDDAMEIADYLIEAGYGNVKVAQASALEQAADVVHNLGYNEVSTNWLYQRAKEIYP